MGFKKNAVQFVYGVGDSLIQIPPLPIIARRAPTVRDNGVLGQVWIDQVTGLPYILVSRIANVSNWASNPVGGATILASLQITGAAGLNISNAGSTLTMAGNVINFTNAGATTTIAGNLTVNGVTTIVGDLDLTSAALIDLTSTLNAAPSIYLHANGGIAEQILLRADQGTSVDSVSLLSDLGGLTLRAAGNATADAINIEAPVGGLDINTGLQINIDSAQAAVNAVRVLASNAAGGIDIDCGTGGITVDSTGAFSIDGVAASNITTTGAGIDLTLNSVLGSVLVRSTEDAPLAIRLHANGGVTETIQLHADQSTAVNSIDLLSDLGGITLTATGNATADAINIVATAGGLDINTALQTNIDSAQVAADAIRIIASNAAGGIDIDCGTGGATLDTTGGFSLDALLASNVTVTGAAADLTLSAIGGSVNVVSTESAANAIWLHANGGVAESIWIQAEQGTSANAITAQADQGGITLSAPNFVSADAINISAGAGGIDMDSALQTNIASSQALNNAIALVASNAAGGITAGAGTGGIVETITNGPKTITTGTGVVSISADATANTLNIGTGAGVKTVNLGSINTTSVTTVQSGSVGLNLTATNGPITANSGTGIVGISTDATANTLNIGTGAGIKTVNLGSVNTTSVTTVQSGTVGVNITATNGPVTLTTGTGLLAICTNATANTLNIGTGAGVKTTTLGSTNAASSTTIQSGTGGVILNGAGIVTVPPVADTQASPSATTVINANVGACRFTGFTTAAGASQVFTFTNALVTATSKMIVTACNEGANDAQMHVRRVNRGAGSFTVTVNNGGAAACNGDITITFWIIANA